MLLTRICSVLNTQHAVGSPVPDVVWARVKLPARLSGCGFGDPALIADGAFLSSAGLVANTLYRESCGNSDPLDAPLFPPNVLSFQLLDILKSSNDVDDARERVNLVGPSRTGNPTSVPCPPLALRPAAL